jgi:hypothetical protein
MLLEALSLLHSYCLYKGIIVITGVANKSMTGQQQKGRMRELQSSPGQRPILLFPCGQRKSEETGKSPIPGPVRIGRPKTNWRICHMYLANCGGGEHARTDNVRRLAHSNRQKRGTHVLGLHMTAQKDIRIDAL